MEEKWKKSVYEVNSIVAPDAWEKIIDEIIQQYNSAQTVAGAKNNRDAMIKNIIKLGSNYSRLHPHTDCNNRTATILLNSELVKHGFSPAILEDPNRLEGFSHDELLEQVLAGMKNFGNVIDNGCYPGGKTNEEIMSFEHYEDFFYWNRSLKETGPVLISDEQLAVIYNVEDTKKPAAPNAKKSFKYEVRIQPRVRI